MQSLKPIIIAQKNRFINFQSYKYGYVLVQVILVVAFIGHTVFLEDLCTPIKSHGNRILSMLFFIVLI